MYVDNTTALRAHQAQQAAAAEHEGALTELLRELESTQQRAAVAAREAAQHSTLAAQLEAQLIEAGKQAQAAAQEATDAGRECFAVQKRADAQVSFVSCTIHLALACLLLYSIVVFACLHELQTLANVAA